MLRRYSLPVLLTAAVFEWTAGAQAPDWWSTRGVLTTNVAADFAPINQGQLKNLAAAAKAEFDAWLPGGASTQIQTLVNGFTANNNYLPVNQGQLKTLAKPFYDQLIASSFVSNYPWAMLTNAPTDFAPANIGQAKNLFSIDLAPFFLMMDSDGDGMSDGWEILHGLDPFDPADAGADADADGMSNYYEYVAGRDPSSPPETASLDLQVWTPWLREGSP
jgi:hypothetical protein